MEKNISDLAQNSDLKEISAKVLVIGTDRNIFKPDSATRRRIAEYGKLFRELHMIIFTKKFQKFEIEKIAENVWIYPTKSWSRWFYPFDAVRVAKSQFGKFLPNKIDIISAQDPFETGIAGWWIAKKFQLPLQIQIHTDFLSPYFWKESFLNKIRVIIGKFLVKRADSIRVVSNRIKNSLKAISHKLKTDPVVLPIFVDIEKIKNAPVSFDVRKKYPQFSFIMIMASRLEKEKNIILAIQIMRELTRHYPKIGMIIIGEGRERKKLESLVAEYNLQRNIIFEGWQNDLISYYKTANVFLSASFYEGYGLTIVEALACGCPVVSSDVGIANEIIINGENGFICPVEDKNCFIRRIQEIMEIPDLKEKLGLNSRVLASKSLSVATKEEYLSKYKSIIEDCLLNRHRVSV